MAGRGVWLPRSVGGEGELAQPTWPVASYIRVEMIVAVFICFRPSAVYGAPPSTKTCDII